MNHPRVLLADDHHLVLERAMTLLGPWFNIVGTAKDGAELVEMASSLNPDVIVADITMPGVSGIEAAHRLRQSRSMAKFVFLTIHAESEFVAACLEEGALGYVLKAHMKTDLIPAINAALSGATFVSPAVAR